jgi:fructokinase
MILCCGEALVDMVPFVSEGAEAFRPCPGGSPYNSAIAIGRLGAPVAFLGRLSTDFFGELLVKRLRDNGVGTELIVRTDQTTTLAFVKLEAGAEPQYAFYTEGSADRSLSPADIPARLPVEARCILFGSISMTMEPVASTIEALVKRERARKDAAAPVISVDPNVRPILISDVSAYVRRLEGWMASSTIVKISAADLEFVYPDLERGGHRQDPTLGPLLVVTTLGRTARSAVAVDRTAPLTARRPPPSSVKVVNTIGRGRHLTCGLPLW